jgi:hypothetical protein
VSGARREGFKMRDSTFKSGDRSPGRARNDQQWGIALTRKARLGVLLSDGEQLEGGLVRLPMADSKFKIQDSSRVGRMW